MSFKDFTLFRFRGISIKLSIYRPDAKSPYQAGGADRYYGRKFKPYYRDKWGRDVFTLTPAQIEDYRQGWEEELGKKDWG